MIVLTAPTLVLAQGGQWSCTANGLKSFCYDGGDRAAIHLAAYSRGGEYPVTRVSETELRGKTQDGTAIICTRR